MRRIFAALIFLLLPQLSIAQDRPSTILVLDASGSMWGQIDGVNKIVIARQVITDLLQSIPDDQNLGLTVYGHRSRGDCADIESVVPPGPGTRDAIAAAVAAINPKGKTPMTDAVVAAAEELRYTEERATVILISDGIETCNPDPCAAARALEAAGVDFTINVVGFDITDAEAMRQLQCLADETGGLLRSASNATEFLAALTEVMIAPEPAPDPAPEPAPDPVPVAPVLANVTLTAVLDDALHTPFPDPLSWTVTGGETPVSIAETGNMVTSNFGLGTYTVTATSAVDASVGTQTVIVTGAGDVVVTVVMPVALPLASIDAPDQAPAGSTIMVTWTGPNDSIDNIEVGLPGDPTSLSYTYTRDGNPAAVILPGQPGTYELRYKLNDAVILAIHTITVTEAPVQLTAPDSAPIGSTIDVGWTGPAAPNDNIELGRVGETGYIDFAYVTEGNPVQIIMPGEPGLYELRYRFLDRDTLVTRPITGVAADLSLSAPDAAPAGSTIDVTWAGPDAELDNVQVGAVGDTGYFDYAYTESGNPVRLVLPAQPGTYELRYRFRDIENILIRPIEVTPATFDISAPDQAPAGSVLSVGWTGPNAALDNIEIGKPGESYVEYSYVRDGNPLSLQLPTEPGSYELRYKFRDREIIATRMIEITAVTARLLAAPAAVAGADVTIGWDGPNNSVDYIAIGLPGDADYASYAAVSTGNPLTLVAPTTPGTYEIRYMSGDTIVTTIPLAVTGP